jgi:GTP-binding protein EngB required for normal cell division
MPRVSHDKKGNSLPPFMEEYLTTRTNLKGVCFTTWYASYPPQKDDVGMYEYLKISCDSCFNYWGQKLDKIKNAMILRKKRKRLSRKKIKFDQNDAFLALSATSKENLAKAYDQLIALLAKRTGKK